MEEEKTMTLEETLRNEISEKKGNILKSMIDDAQWQIEYHDKKAKEQREKLEVLNKLKNEENEA